MAYLFLCFRCRSKDLVLRGDFFGCNSCGHWTERKRYGSEALQPLLNKDPTLPQTKSPSTTTSSSDETSISDGSARRLLTRREKALRLKTFRDPRGP